MTNWSCTEHICAVIDALVKHGLAITNVDLTEDEDGVRVSIMVETPPVESRIPLED